MRISSPGRTVSILRLVCALTLLTLTVGRGYSFGAEGGAAPAYREDLRRGERMYREGILPSGNPMDAIVKGDLPVPGTSFTCVSCHLRGGLGSFEGGVITPPTSAAKLFKPFKVYSAPSNASTPFKPTPVVQAYLKYYQASYSRPVYTDASLAVALRDGIDPAGRVLNDVMPRYPLGSADMQTLITYLRTLSDSNPPGVTEDTIHFATIVTDEVSAADRNAMLVPLQNFITNKNVSNFLPPGARSRSTGVRSRLMTDVVSMSRGLAIKKLSLSCWVLKGPRESWPGQLEEYNRKDPAFAILGGISYGGWEPVHRFCEENHIPDLFPITDFPVVSSGDWYTLYFSKGYYQEGEGAAHFLKEQEPTGRPVLQIVRDTPQGRALSRGFLETWSGLGLPEPRTVLLKPRETLDAATLARLAAEQPAAILLWDGPECQKSLLLLAAGEHPPQVLVSSSYLGKETFTLDRAVRGFTYLTYPYGMTQLPEEKSALSMSVKQFDPLANSDYTIRVSEKSYILTLILDMALMEMRGNYYRDNLLDVIGMIMDQDAPLYERISFGPGQRYASKGCYVVQLGESGLVKKSIWLTH